MKYGTYAVPRLDLGEALHEYRGSAAGFIGMQALPELPVLKKEATISVITRESMLKRVDAKRAPDGSYNRLSLVGEDLAYACEEYGLEGPVDDAKRAQYASDFDLELETAKQLELSFLREQEVRHKDLLFNTTTWTGAALYTDNSAAPWDAVGSDAIGQVRAAKEKVRQLVGLDPDTLIMGQPSLLNLMANTAIIARLAYVKVATEDVILSSMAAILGVKRILVGGGVYDSADEGLDTTVADIWGDDYAMVAVTAPEGAGITEACVGRTILWTEDSPDIVVAEEYREEQTRGKVLRVRHNTDDKVFDPSFAHLMKVDA